MCVTEEGEWFEDWRKRKEIEKSSHNPQRIHSRVRIINHLSLFSTDRIKQFSPIIYTLELFAFPLFFSPQHLTAPKRSERNRSRPVLHKPVSRNVIWFKVSAITEREAGPETRAPTVFSIPMCSCHVYNLYTLYQNYERGAAVSR